MPQKTRQRLSQTERRKQLLRGALAEAANVGLGRLTHAGVARKCGVAVPTAFSYFENRSALVVATVEEVKRFYLELASYWHRPEIGPTTAIEGHINAYADSIKEEPHYAQVWLEWCTAVRNEDGIWESYLDYYDSIIKMIASSIKRGQKQGEIPKTINAADAARLILSTGMSLTQMHFMRRDKAQIKRFVKQSVQLALQGALPHER